MVIFKPPKEPLIHAIEVLTNSQDLHESSQQCFTSNRGAFWQASETLLTSNLVQTIMIKASISLEHQIDQIYNKDVPN